MSRRYTSTWYIHPTTHKHDFEPMDGRGRYICQPPQCQAVNPSRWPTLPPPFTPQPHIAVVTTPHRFAAGVHSIDKPTQYLPVDVYFAASTEDHPGFFRLLYEWEDVSESDFFERARLAFPRLVFAADISFRKFQGAYRTLRPQVVDHLGRINDRFPEVYAAENGMPNGVSSRLGIQISIEGNTRSSERLMRLRDVKFRGRVYRCEWHSKLEPHRNRIHFQVIDGIAETKILIGIFHEHLPT